ncbi:hypothetical protein Daura_17610 [Dactylosporangium aurantiacum]|uniref:Uncharacterized protein n=1 Tax=Dactylosporangium aurantiacum TaxID=35754 RepID=A0A9Q9MQR3_9ACTN|nr:hypothetical protein [Dactylosporangium aurantiacum]MDG6109837.1 hypothetical protein [Dactylosporangium aurantiacum]UWZ57822.1 hypothetical protein Daura_17610 [Dactylosporangium aurantiacum]
MDVYVWVPQRRPGTVTAFVDRYVDRANPSDERLAAFIRAYGGGTADDADRSALDELRRDASDPGLSLYLKARGYYHAIMTVTGEGALVLGLSIDDPDGSAAVAAQARALLDALREEFDAPAGRAGVELEPAHSRQEWDDEATVLFRSGAIADGTSG